jgi:hypothetical protein
MRFFCSSKLQDYVGFAILLVLFGSLNAQAQSGRQPTKPTPYPPPPTVATVVSPAPAVNAKLGEFQHKTKVLIGRQPTQRKLQAEDIIFASLVNRLNEYANLEGVPLGNLKREEARERAKAQSESFVVWLGFAVDHLQSGTIILNSPDLVIDYAVLAPRTAKPMTKGKVYFQSIGGGRLRKSEWPGGTPIRITPAGAGIQIAEHVYDWLRLNEVRKRRAR